MIKAGPTVGSISKCCHLAIDKLLLNTAKTRSSEFLSVFELILSSVSIGMHAKQHEIRTTINQRTGTNKNAKHKTV